MRTITIPLELMLDTTVSWDIDWRGQSSGETNSGSRQIVYNAFPRWVGKPKLALEGQQIAEWRAIRARAQGRHNVYRVPMIDPLSFDYSLISKKTAEVGVPNTNNALFSTGNGFSYVPLLPVVADPLTSAYPAKGGYHIWVETYDMAFEPRIGAIYSAKDFPFIVTEVLTYQQLVGEPAYDPNNEEPYFRTLSIRRLSVEMPLRTALVAGDVVQLIPHGLFFAESDRTGQGTYGGVPYSQPEFSLVEWLR